MSQHHLAQINIARVRHPIEDPVMEGFTGNLDRINALAERSEGFVWRLQDDSGNATAIQAYDDASIIVNLTVWTSIEALENFAYKTAHKQFIGRRQEWFIPMDGPYLALWWVLAGTMPSAAQGREKLEILGRTGPSSAAFAFASRFPAPLMQPAALPISPRTP